MAENQSNVAPLKPVIGTLEAVVEGKVTNVEQPKESEWTYYTVSLKAKDEYSRNETVQVSQQATERPFARVDDVIKVKVHLGGYGRRYNGNLYITNTLQFVETV